MSFKKAFYAGALSQFLALTVSVIQYMLEADCTSRSILFHFNEHKHITSDVKGCVTGTNPLEHSVKNIAVKEK